MTLAVEKLYAAVFGVHLHPCPSDRCKGAERACSDPYDCQLVPKLCATCAILDEDMREQRADWRSVDRILKTGVKI